MEDWIELIVIAIFLFVAIFAQPVIGGLVNQDKALQAAQAQLSPTAELAPRDPWFVAFKGCDQTDVVLFPVKPYVGPNGKIVDNAIVCSGFPIFSKGFTIRFR